MISNPKYGWCNFELGSFSGTPSYITNVPIDLLKGFIEYFTTGTAAIWFDEEGTEFTLVINPYSMFIIAERDKEPELFDLSEMKIENIAKELIADIKGDMVGWSNFVVIGDDEEIKYQREQINQLIVKLEKLIKRK